MGLSSLRIALWISRVSSAIIVILMVAVPFRNAWAADASPNPTFALVGAVLKLENGKGEGQAAMLLKADGLDKTKKDYPTKPDIRDLGVPDPPPVKVNVISVTPMQVGESSRSWLLSAQIKELPANTSQKRYLLVQYAGFDTTLDYTLTNKYDTPFSWTLKPPPSEISIRSGQPIEIGIAVGPVPASKVRLLQANLIEKSQKYPLAKAGLMLCKNPTGGCQSEINLEERSANRLWLRTKDQSYPVGRFEGSVTIAASEKPEGDTITLTVNSTRFWWRQFWGVIVILAGVVIAWIVSTYGPSRVTRDQLLLPVALVREKFQRMQTTLTQTPPQIDSTNTETTSGKLTRLLGDLSESGLDSKGYLPYTPPLPLPGMAPKLDEFKVFLQKMEGWAVALDEIIRGMASAWDKVKRYPSSKHPLINTTVHRLDEFVTVENAPALDKLKSDINKELTDLSTQLGTPSPSAAVSRGLLAKKEASTRMLRLEISLVNWAMWLVVCLLTTLVGSYVVVWSNLGFGLPTDYVFCLLWGFGIPIGGQQLLQLTPKNVVTTLGISGPK